MTDPYLGVRAVITLACVLVFGYLSIKTRLGTYLAMELYWAMLLFARFLRYDSSVDIAMGELLVTIATGIGLVSALLCLYQYRKDLKSLKTLKKAIET